MFEFEDSKLGRVKILNVTEARSSIAAIMNDAEFNYIITKNNKPIRVIINYDSYKKTKNQLQPTAAPKAVPAKAPEPKSQLAGLIGTREKELKSTLTSPLSPTIETAVGGEEELTFLEMSDEELTEIAPEESTAIEALVDTTDKSDDVYWTEDTVVEVEETPSIRDLLKDEPEEERTVLEEPEAPPPAPKSRIYQPVVQEEPLPPAQASAEPDYFSRYQKLYEPSSLKPVEEPKAEPVLPPITAPIFDVEPEGPTMLEEPEPVSPAPVAAPKPEPEKPRHREVPSIQDLLRDLENEKLSGDDE
ncbi:type II toxin-antitoxin system Phd/YefM family antitoxin [bacterium]|nr:type II toxin-antitoxin system Phd/YefM family antitoxin [bacterium]